MFLSAFPSIRPLTWFIVVLISPVPLSLSILFSLSIFAFIKANTVRKLSGIAFYLFLTCLFMAIKPKEVSYSLRSDESGIFIIENIKISTSGWYTLESRNTETKEKHLIRLKAREDIFENDTLVVQAKWKPIESGILAQGFDPRSYYLKKATNKEAFVQLYKLVKGPRLKTKNEELKTSFSDALSGLSEENKALCLGMLLGDKSAIEKEALEQFKACGLMHILAVSGMHVGLLAALPLILLSATPKNWRWIIVGLKSLSVIGVWCFASFVGLGPSVVRSGLMFTAILTSAKRGSIGSKINLLCGVGFIMLLVEPNWIYELGFQLSFLAVFGILLLGSLLQPFYSSCHWLVKKLFSIVNISISAQLLTLPLVVFHFHEFPSYFLLGNLIVAPLLILAIYLTLLLLVLNAFSLPSSWLVYAVDSILTFAMELAQGIAQLPFAVIRDLKISEITVVFLFVIIATIVRALSTSDNRKVKLMQILLGLASIGFIVRLSTMLKSTSPTWINSDLVYVENKGEVVLFSKASKKSTLRIQEQLEKQKGMQVKVVLSNDTLISTPFEVGVFNGLLFIEGSTYINPFNLKRINSLIQDQRKPPRDSIPE